MAHRVKNLPAMQETQETQIQSLGQEDPWRRKWQPTPVFLPGKSHGQRSLAGYSPWHHKELDMTKRLSNNNSLHKCPNTLPLSEVGDHDLLISEYFLYY